MVYRLPNIGALLKIAGKISINIVEIAGTIIKR
jgi:hypothetical protein